MQTSTYHSLLDCTWMLIEGTFNLNLSATSIYSFALFKSKFFNNKFKDQNSHNQWHWWIQCCFPIFMVTNIGIWWQSLACCCQEIHSWHFECASFLQGYFLVTQWRPCAEFLNNVWSRAQKMGINMKYSGLYLGLRLTKWTKM